MDGLNRRNPELAEKIKPEIEEYITIRANCDTNDFLTEEFRHDGTLPYDEQKFQEADADKKDAEELGEDYVVFLQTHTKPEPLPSVKYAPSKPATDNPDPAAGDSGCPVPIAPPGTPVIAPAKGGITYPPDYKRY